MKGCSRVHAKAVKKWVLDEHGPRCAYCRRKVNRSQATVDHIVPLSRGGTHHLSNLTFACQGCNQLKGSMMPEEFKAAMKSYFAKLIALTFTMERYGLTTPGRDTKPRKSNRKEQTMTYKNGTLIKRRYDGKVLEVKLGVDAQTGDPGTLAFALDGDATYIVGIKGTLMSAYEVIQ